MSRKIFCTVAVFPMLMFLSGATFAGAMNADRGEAGSQLKDREETDAVLF